MMSEGLVHFKEESIPLVQEFRYSIAVYQSLNAGGKFFAITYLRRFIQHFHQELLVLRALHHDGILVLFFALFVCDGLLTRVV